MVLFCFFAGQSFLNADSSAIIKIRAHNSVSKNTIELGDIADIVDDSGEKLSILNHLIVGEIASGESQVVWTSSEVSRRLRPYASLMNHMVIKIPEKTTVERASQSASIQIEKQLKNTLKSLLPDQSWVIQLSDLQVPENFKSMGSDEVFSVVMPGVRPRGEVVFEVQVSKKDQAEIVVKNIKVKAHVAYFTDVATLSEPIFPKASFNEEKLSWHRRDVTYFNEIPASHDAILNSVSKTTLTAGTILMRSNLEREMVLKFGEPTELIANDENFSIHTKGVAQQNGFIGDTVKVRSNGSQKIVNGIVVSKGLVRVEY